MARQATVARSITTRGVGVHSGQSVRLAIQPAPAGSGVTFVRTDLPDAPRIPARADLVVDTRLATTLGRDGVRLSTVEHLLAALAGVGIDNATVEVDGPEVPIMDGSAAPWVTLLAAAGRRELDAPRTTLVVDRRVAVREGDREIAVEPSAHLEIAYEIAFEHAAIPAQSLRMVVNPARFASELAPARTFGFLAEVQALKARGLARGGSLDNAVVVLNPEGLRFPDEFVRHKALDLVGDLALIGLPVRGRVMVARGGHRLHAALLAALLADRSAWHVEGGATRRPESARRPALVAAAPVLA
jgi:UDP-3-O-[3-hydroxymyristoyl] N-acetylglucosamine deacetylase